MNGFDILVLIVVGISALLAFARGFIRELLSMAALLVGVLAALWGLPVFREAVRGIIQPNWIADTATVAGIFLLVYIAVRVLTGRIHEWVHDSEPLGILDRSAGILFGVARGFAIMAMGVLIITSVAKKEMYPKLITEARFYPFLFLTAEAFKSLAPNAANKASDMAKNAAAAGEEAARWRDQTEMLQDATNTLSQGDIANFGNVIKNNKENKKPASSEDKETTSNSLKVETKQ